MRTRVWVLVCDYASELVPLRAWLDGEVRRRWLTSESILSRIIFQSATTTYRKGQKPKEGGLEARVFQVQRTLLLLVLVVLRGLRARMCV